MSSFKIKRRDFLNLGALSLATPVIGSLLPKAAWGQAPQTIDHFFVHIQIEGAMDVLHSVDPLVPPEAAKHEDIHLAYNPNSDILRQGPFALAPPARALAKHLADVAIINGVWMSADGLSSHEACRTYMASGMTGERREATIVDFEVASLMPRGYLDLIMNTRREAYNLRHKDVESRVTLELLQQALNKGVSLTDLLVPEFLRMGEGSALAQSGAKWAQAELRSKAFVDILKNSFGQVEDPATVEPEEIIALAFQSMAAGQAFLNLGGDFNGPGPGLDCHGDFESHPSDVQWYFDRIDKIFSLFKRTPAPGGGASLFDQTTFFITNEFSRPPYLNSMGGKDHNPSTNSVILAGKNVRSGVAGESWFFTAQEKSDHGIAPISSSMGSTAEHVGAPFDFKTGKSFPADDRWSLAQQPLEKYSLIKPENVVATLRDILRIPPKDFKSVAPEVSTLRRLVL